MDEERLRAWVETPLGRWCAFAAFSALLYCFLFFYRWTTPNAGLISAIIALALFFPHRKFEVLAFSGILWLLGQPSPLAQKPYYDLLEGFGFAGNGGQRQVLIFVSMYVGMVLMMAYRFWISRQAPSSRIRKFALFVFIAIYFALALFFPFKVLSPSLQLAFWLTILGLTPLGYLGFDLEALKMDRPLTGFKRLAFYLPFWRLFWFTPINGEVYQRAVESKTAPELARVRLHGLRLLAWAVALQSLNLLFPALIFEDYYPRPFDWTHQVPSLHLPSMEAALQLIEHGRPLSPLTAWGVMYGTFFYHFLAYTAFGHVMVACARMVGFNAFRNTYRPLRAETLNDFFGRYNYYFKELLLHLFYFPVYFEFFRDRPRLRVIAAVLASVGIGNFVFHSAFDLGYIQNLGAGGFSVHELPYAFYCLILSTALSISTLREMQGRHRQSVGRFRQVLRIIAILTFYACLSIFDTRYNGRIQNNFGILFRMFGF